MSRDGPGKEQGHKAPKGGTHMAQFRFSVSRRGSDAVECIATVPSLADLRNYAGGEVKVQTPRGVKVVNLSSSADLLQSAMAVQLQNGVRNELFPHAKEQAMAKRSRSGYQS